MGGIVPASRFLRLYRRRLPTVGIPLLLRRMSRHRLLRRGIHLRLWRRRKMCSNPHRHSNLHKRNSSHLHRPRRLSDTLQLPHPQRQLSAVQRPRSCQGQVVRLRCTADPHRLSMIRQMSHGVYHLPLLRHRARMVSASRLREGTRAVPSIRHPARAVETLVLRTQDHRKDLARSLRGMS